MQGLWSVSIERDWLAPTAEGHARGIRDGPDDAVRRVAQHRRHSVGRNTAPPRPSPPALIVMAAVGTTAAGLLMQLVSNANMFGVTW
jgi:hypothetical protein